MGYYTEHPDDRRLHEAMLPLATARGMQTLGMVNTYGFCSAYEFELRKFEDPFVVLAGGAFWICGREFRKASHTLTRTQDTALAGPFTDCEIALAALALEE